MPGPFSVAESHTPLPPYDRQPEYDKMKQDRDVMVPMRDGVRLCVDVYRPDAQEKLPVLLAFCAHNKDLQTPEATESFGPHPAWSPFWLGAQEAGDTRFFVSRGYAHVIGNPRGVGKSEEGDSPTLDFFGPPEDIYELIEWIAQQPWCDGNIGMVGISAFAGAQWQAAMQQPPHLKAIFPYDAMPMYTFRDFYPGGVIHAFMYLLDQLGVSHWMRGRPGPLPPEVERLWQEAMNNPDYKMYGHLYNVLTQKRQHTPGVFDLLLNPYDTEEAVKSTDANFGKIKVPAYTGAGWYAYTYKAHLQGCQHWYEGIKVPKKLLFTGPAHLERPFHSFHGEILRWYDYWLKGIDTGIMAEPLVKMWVMGANEWYYADDWPVPETRWTKYYLHSWERLREEPFTPSSRDAYDEPDAFVQMPPSQTRTIQRLRYMTDPLPEDTLIAGPSALYLYAAIDQEDTNWIIILKDVGPDVSVRTAREGETTVPADLPERELTRGWLKASHRALNPKRSKPWKPWHPLTREAQKPVVPGEINEYAIEILSTANLFKKGHRICVDITSLDVPTGTAGFTNVEYVPYHICSSKTVLHKIYHNEKYPSHLLLPVVPQDDSV
jgi:putative CocE/NonD family hydrolase